MVGVPALLRCDLGPSSRTACPIWFSTSRRIIVGPTISVMASEVSTLRMPRNVRYLNTPKALAHPLSQSASHSNISAFLYGHRPGGCG